MSANRSFNTYTVTNREEADMPRTLRLACGLALLTALVGCGGGQQAAVAPPTDGTPDTLSVGPMVIHPAASGSDVAIETLPADNPCTFVSLSGAPMDYVASEAMMDRIVYHVYTGSGFGLGVCDLFGGNQQMISSEGDFDPQWSPGGDLIVTSSGFGTAAEIVLMNADGSNRTPLTANSRGDYDPAFSPDGLLIAFEGIPSGEDREIFTINLDGTGETNLTANAVDDYDPFWTQDSDLLVSREDGLTRNITRINESGALLQTVTDPAGSIDDEHPAISPDGSMFAFTRVDSGDSDIYICDSDGDHVRKFTAGSEEERDPCFSTCGRYIAFARQDAVTGRDIWIKETTPPYREYQVAGSVNNEDSPHLGSPTRQIHRVLVGESGADHGYDPVHEHAIAAVVAYDGDGYKNFVRLGIPPNEVSSLQVTPLEGTGSGLAGVVWSAQNMYYIEQDEGLGADTTLWDMPGISRSIALYFDGTTGKLVSVLDLDDDTTTATADSTGGLSHRLNGCVTTVRGNVRAVYGPDGELVADGDVGAVEIDADRGVVRAF